MDTPNQPSLKNRTLRLIATGLLVLIAGSWARIHFRAIRVGADAISEPGLVSAQQRAQPLVEALEKYRAENGLYPASLNALSPDYIASTQILSDFRYSARRLDWVFQSDDCIAREKDLTVLLPKAASFEQSAPSSLLHNCISGFREYQLQSPDFPVDTRSRYLERWAYYDSQPQYWSLGWCEQVRPLHGEPQHLATNGVCRNRTH